MTIKLIHSQLERQKIIDEGGTQKYGEKNHKRANTSIF
jgi:hypothetical protein